jgi:hypothetical protein
MPIKRGIINGIARVARVAARAALNHVGLDIPDALKPKNGESADDDPGRQPPPKSVGGQTTRVALATIAAGVYMIYTGKAEGVDLIIMGLVAWGMLSAGDAKPLVAVGRGLVEMRRNQGDEPRGYPPVPPPPSPPAPTEPEPAESPILVSDRTELVALWADAIARMEGTRQPDGGYRNNNPGNLRGWSPRTPKDSRGFDMFATEEQGWAALRSQIEKNLFERNLTPLEFFAGKPGVYGGYAPASDNNHPEGYARFVVAYVTENGHKIALDEPVNA